MNLTTLKRRRRACPCSDGQPFQWYVSHFCALVVYVYFNEISKKNWKGVAAGFRSTWFMVLE